jgi:cell division protein FtsW
MLAASTLSARIKRGKANSLYNVWNLKYGIIFIMAGLIELEPDLGTAAIVVGVPLIMAVVAGMSFKYVLWLLGAVVMAVTIMVNLQPYRMARLKVWFDPWADAQGMGYQTVQSLSTIGSGGFWGMGLGEGVSKYEYLPEAHTDFAFAIFCQEWGYVGALFLIACFLILARALFCIAMNTKDRKGYLLVAGSTLFLIGQSAANMAMVTGVLPVIGVPLLFISYGGTSLLANMFALGLVVSVYRSECAREIMEERIAAGLPPVEEGRLRVVSSGRRGRPFR